MEAEREALMEAAYPEVQAFCQKHGLMFEVVDLRWGIRDVTGAGHAQLALEEIRRCQELSVGPSFVALLGSRYGPCPAPATIGEEDFEALAAQLRQEEPQALQMLTRWYLKDENTTPPVYALQHPLPHSTEQSLVLALRRAAQEAERKGRIGQYQRLRYHKSETHQEIEARLLGSGPEDEGAAVVFLREMETSSDAEGEEEGEDARRMLDELKGAVASACPRLLRVHRAPRDAAPGALRPKPQPKHLKELCDQFVAVANYQALRGLRAQEGRPDGRHQLLRELAHHAALAVERSRSPCWRPELVDSLCQRLRDSLPQCHPLLVVRGPRGCGKTTLLCHLWEAVCRALGPEAVVVFRLLGASQASSGRDALLGSLCQQVCLALGLCPPGGGDPLLRFHHALLSASHRGSQPLVLILDAVESLGLAWLPAVCPPGVQVVVSARDEGGSGGSGSGGAFRGDSFVVASLSAEEAGNALAKGLASAGRTLRPDQQALLRQSFSAGGQGLPLSLALAEACRWTSYAPLLSLPVPLTAPEAAHRLCGRLEEVHGSVLVANALGYLACARNGLAEAEMKDVLSLDNEVLSEVYRSHPPPGQGVLRLPPLLWSRLCRDLNPELEEKWCDGFGLMGFVHRDFSAAVEERYLSRPEDRARRHLLLADFFRGTWSWGAKKPLLLPSSAKPVSLDRKVTPQPLWFSSRCPNRRKLSEQPFHLLHGGRMEELRRDVLGNMAWISSRVASSGVPSLAEDFDLCLTHVTCPEVRLVRDCLLLLLPEPSADGVEGRLEPNVVYTEMLARLEWLAPSYPGGLIAGLCQQCKSWLGSRPHPSLVPLAGFLDPPDGPLRKTLPAFPQGTSVLESSPDQRMLLAGSRDGSILVWDTEDFSVRHVLLGHSAEVRCLGVFAKGTRAVSVARDRTLRLWSLESGREEAVMPIAVVPAGDQAWCQLSVDDKHQIVYWVSDTEVEAWHLGTAAPAFRIPAEPLGGWLCAAVFVPRLVVVTVSAGGCVCLWDSLSGQLLSRQPLGGLREEGGPTCGALLRKMGRMVSGFSGGSLLMVPALGQGLGAEGQGHRSQVSSEGRSLLERLPEKICFVALSEDESLLATGFGRRVRIFLPDPTGFCQGLNSDLLHGEEVCAAAIAADNTTVFTSSRSECIWVWRLAQEGWLRDVWGDRGAPTTHLTLCSTLLVSASLEAPYLRIWDPGNDPVHKPLPPCMAGAKCVGLSRNGENVCFPRSFESCELVLWDVEEGEECGTLDTSAAVRCLEVAPQRKLVFVGLASGTVLVFPLDSLQDVGCIPPAENRKPVCALALAQSEEQVAVACEDLVQVLDVGQGHPGPLIDRPAFSFYTQIPGADISCVALLGGYRVLYGMTGGQLFLYHCLRGQVFALEAHGNSGITCLQTSHGETWALSGSADSLQCLWDVDRCRWEHRMFFQKEDSFSQGVLCACFSRDDRLLFTASLDQCVTVWDVSCGALLAVQLVHARVTRIVPTPDGFVAATRLGHLIRERFRHPPSASSHYDPLGGIRATCRVTSRRTGGEEEEDVPGGQLGHRGDHAPQAGHSHADNKLSQICRIV